MSSPKPRHDALSKSKSNSPSRFGRVVVLLDVTSDPAPVLESATGLAAGLQARLMALFVEDRRLEQIENHPLVRAIDLPTGLDSAVDSDSMRRSSRALVHRLHDRVARLSQQYQLQAGFELVGGDVRAKIRELTTSSDLLVVESSGRHLSPHFRTASRGHVMGRGLNNPVVFVGARPRPLRSVAVVYDGSAQARRGLDTALRFASNRPMMLTVLVVGSAASQTEELRDEIKDTIDRRDVRVHPHLRRITCCDTGEILHIAANVHADLVVVPSNDTYPDDRDIDRLTRRLDCPVLVLRRREDRDSSGSTPENDCPSHKRSENTN